MCNFTFISKFKIRNRLQIAAAVRSDLILFDMSKMAVVSKRKSVQDIVKSVKMAPFSEYILATSAQPNYSVQITNLRSNQTIPILQKEPIAGIAWLRKNQILVSIWCNYIYLLSIYLGIYYLKFDILWSSFFFRSLPTMKKSLHTNYLINKRNKDWIFYSHPLEVFHGRSSNSKSQTDPLANYNYDFWFRFPSLLNDDTLVPKTFFSNPTIAFWNNLYKSSNKMIRAKFFLTAPKMVLFYNWQLRKRHHFWCSSNKYLTLLI